MNQKRKKWSLYAMEHGGEIERRTTENICSVDYLYDLPFASGEERQFLEHAYEELADRHFTEITEFITNDSKEVLSVEMREKILKSCLSLYFRTPKFVDLDQSALDSIQFLPENEQEMAWNIKKSQLLEESVKNFGNLYNIKKDCGISVNKAVRDWEFISGDNPVIIRNGHGVVMDPFSSQNIIHVPITPKYAISIMPSSEHTLKNTFYRTLYDDDHVMSTNYSIEQYHERYLLGTKKALESYLKESPVYKEPAPPNHPKILKVTGVAIAVQNLVSVLIRNNGIVNNEVKNYFNWCWENVDGFKDDPNSQKVREQIANDQVSER